MIMMALDLFDSGRGKFSAKRVQRIPFSAEKYFSPKTYAINMSEGIYRRLRCKKVFFLSQCSQNTIACCDDVPLSFQRTTVTMTSYRLLRRILPTMKAEIDGIDAVIGDCK